MNKELTKDDGRELHLVAKRINDRESTIQSLRKKTEESAESTICEAVLQGQDLLKAKAMLPHGLFQEWIATHCPLIKYRTAATYMRVAANVQRFTNGIESIRQAIALIQSDMDPQAKEPTAATPDDLQALYRLNMFTKHVSRHPISAYPPEVVRDLAIRLEPTIREIKPTLRQLYPDLWG